MNNAAAHPGGPSPQTLPLQAAARLWVILGGLRGAIAAWGGRDRAAVPLVVLAWGRVGRLAQRFEALMARLTAGTLRAPRGRGRTRTHAARPAAPGGDAVRLPRGFGWMVRLLQETAGFGCQLQALLAEPEVAALLAGCPQAGRILRPLRRMLGIAEPGAPVRDPRPMKPRWWETVPAPAAPEVTPCGRALFPPGRPPPCWSG